MGTSARAGTRGNWRGEGARGARRVAAAAGADRRRGAARGDRSPPSRGRSQRSREHRRAGRSRLLRRVRPLRDRRPAGAPRDRRADRPHSRRRPDRRHGADQRRAVRSRGRGLRRDLLRLHGSRRDPGGARPPQEGPAVRADRADATADRALRRGRWRPPRRHRLSRRLRPRHPRLRPLGRALGTGAADRRRRRPLLRRQRRPRRLLGSDRRHRERLAGDGRTGNDRGWRPRRRPPGRDRASRDAGRQRRRRPGLRRRGRGDRGGETAARLLPGDGGAGHGAGSGAVAGAGAGAPAPRLRPGPDRRDARRQGLGHLPARALRAGDGDGAGPDRGPRGGHHRQRLPPHGRSDHQRRRRQGGPLPAALRRLRAAGRLPHRHARVHGRHRGRGDRPGPPRLTPAAGRGGATGAADRRDPAPRLRPRRPGDDRRQPA